MANRIGKFIYLCYKVFSIEYRLLEAIKRKKQNTAIMILKMNKALLKYTDKDNWNLLDYCSMFKADNVAIYVKSKCNLENSIQYKTLLAEMHINKLLKSKYTTNSLKLIKQCFILQHNLQKIDVNSVTNTVNLFINKNGY